MAAGNGWEDCFVALGDAGMVTDRDRMAIRRYVLGLSQMTRRYGT